MSVSVNTQELETKVLAMYRQVALEPGGQFHFELGAALALRLGYDERRLTEVPAGAVESFAGVGFVFDLADLRVGETVVDLGSGSGTDAFYAARLVGATGHVHGVDFSPEQRDKARGLAHDAGLTQVEFHEGRIEHLPLPDAAADCVISNGVINLCPDKRAVFSEAARVLRPGARLAVADIVTERPLKDAIVCDADLWASCVGGAVQRDSYLDLIRDCGFTVRRHRVNPYAFLSDRARGASERYGVSSISLLAIRNRH